MFSAVAWNSAVACTFSDNELHCMVDYGGFALFEGQCLADA